MPQLSKLKFCVEQGTANRHSSDGPADISARQPQGPSHFLRRAMCFMAKDTCQVRLRRRGGGKGSTRPAIVTGRSQVCWSARTKSMLQRGTAFEESIVPSLTDARTLAIVRLSLKLPLVLYAPMVPSLLSCMIAATGFGLGHRGYGIIDATASRYELPVAG